MVHLFITPEQITQDVARISGPDHLHLARVLRARPGQSVVLLDNRGNAFQSVLVTVEKSETVARIETPLLLPPEPPIQIIVAQALGKGDKFEQVIQHGTEVGASGFIPVKAERSVVEVPAGKMAERMARWRQIAKGAAEQSRRAIIPEVAEPLSLLQLFARLPAGTPMLLLHPSPEAKSLASALRDDYRQCSAPQTSCKLFIAIGPEGGWSGPELALRSASAGAEAAKPMLVTLGPRVLRTETAALVAISQILYHVEQFCIEQSEYGDQPCVY